MKSSEILRILMERPTMVNCLVKKLNENGMISDEDNDLKISSTMLEYWTDECTDYLHKNGYTGKSLTFIGGYFEGHGAIYVLYDQSIGYEEAKHYLEEEGARDSQEF